MISNRIIKTDNINDAWQQWYDILHNQNESNNSRDGGVVGEVLNSITVLTKPTNNILTNEIRGMSIKYAIGEMLWYLSGNKSLSEIQKYTKNWDRMSDDGETVNSNYGNCIKYKYGFNQWEYVKVLLQEYPDTRQAVIHIKEASDKESRDINCTVYLQFFIRNGKLYMTSSMRSNDIWLGFPYDVFQFTCMQILMSMELGIPLGEYTHIANSLHLYGRNKIKDYEDYKLYLDMKNQI